MFKLKKNIDSLSISIIFCLLFNVTYIFINPKSRDNYQKLGYSLKLSNLNQYFLLNLSCIGILVIIYISIKQIFTKNRIFRKNMQKLFSRNFLIILLAIPFTLPLIMNRFSSNPLSLIYKLFRISNEPNLPFRDLIFLLNSIKSFEFNGKNIVFINTGEITTAYNYPINLLHLNFLGTLLDHPIAFYLLFSVFFVFGIISLANNNFNIFILSLFIFSGSTFLIFERGNTELLILPLIVLSVNFLGRSFAAFFVSTMFIYLACQLKLHPIFLLVYVFLFLTKNWYQKSISGLFFIIGFFEAVRDVQVIGLSNISFGFAATFGFKPSIAILTGNQDVSPLHFNLNIATLFCIFQIILVSYLSYRKNYSLNQSTMNGQLAFRSRLLFIFGSIMLIISWISTSSYAYRLLLFLLCIPYLSLKFKSNTNLGIWLITLFLVACNTFPLSLTPIRLTVVQLGVSVLLGILFYELKQDFIQTRIASGDN